MIIHFPRKILAISLICLLATALNLQAATTIYQPPEGTTFTPPNSLPRVHAGAYNEKGSEIFVSHIHLDGNTNWTSIRYNVTDKIYQLLVNIEGLQDRWLDATKSFSSQVTKEELSALGQQTYTATNVNQQGTIIGFGGKLTKEKNGGYTFLSKPVLRKAGDNNWTELEDPCAGDDNSGSVPLIISTDSKSILGWAASDGCQVQTSGSSDLVTWNMDNKGNLKQTNIPIDPVIAKKIKNDSFQHVPVDYSTDLNRVLLNFMSNSDSSDHVRAFYQPFVNAVTLTRNNSGDKYAYHISSESSLALGLSNQTVFMSQIDKQQIVQMPVTDMSSDNEIITYVSNSYAGLSVLSKALSATSYINYHGLKNGFYSGILELSDYFSNPVSTFYGNGQRFYSQDEFAYSNNMTGLTSPIIYSYINSDNRLVTAYGDAGIITVIEFEKPFLP